MTSNNESEHDREPGIAPDREVPDAFILKEAERYTMAEAAAIKGVSYHTVSRAVRQGRLPVTRLGRMALIGGQDLANWEPMRERAPRRFRQEPTETRTPSPVIEEAFGGRVEIARHLAAMFEVIHAASSELSLEPFGEVLTNRFATMFGLTRASLWVFNARDGTGQRLASVGPSFTTIPDTVPISAAFAKVFSVIELGNARVSVDPQTEFADSGEVSELPRGPLLIVPLRVRNRTIGALFGDRDGKSLAFDQDQLALAQVLGNQVALAVDHAMLRKEQRFRINQLSAILDQMGDQVRACDTHGRLNLINRTDKIYNSGEGGPTPEMGSDALDNPGVAARTELDGTPILRDRHPLARALRGEVVNDWEYDVTRTDGRVQRAQVSARPIVVDGEITGAVYIGRNVSERRERERQDEERVARLDRSARHASSMVDVITGLTALKTARQIVQQVLDCLVLALGTSRGLGLTIGENGHLVLCATSGLSVDQPVPPMENPISISTTILAFSRESPVVVDRSGAGRAEQELMTSLQATRLLVVPVQIEQQPVGALHIFLDDADVTVDEDLDFANALGHLCAQAIDRLRLHDTLGRTLDRMHELVDQAQ